MMGSVPLQRNEETKNIFSLSTSRIQGEGSLPVDQKVGPHQERVHIDTLISSLPAFETVKNKFFLSKPLSLYYSVKAL